MKTANITTRIVTKMGLHSRNSFVYFLDNEGRFYFIKYDFMTIRDWIEVAEKKGWKQIKKKDVPKTKLLIYLETKHLHIIRNSAEVTK